MNQNRRFIFKYESEEPAKCFFADAKVCIRLFTEPCPLPGQKILAIAEGDDAPLNHALVKISVCHIAPEIEDGYYNKCLTT